MDNNLKRTIILDNYENPFNKGLTNDENFDKVQTLKAELAAVEKENAQLEVSIESNLNLTNLEQQARSLLGMQKLTNRQTEYVNLPKTDYIETAAEEVVMEEETGLLETIGNYLSQLFK